MDLIEGFLELFDEIGEGVVVVAFGGLFHVFSDISDLIKTVASA